MVTFHALTMLKIPRLYIWRPDTPRVNASSSHRLLPIGCDGNGLFIFPAELDHQIHEYVFFKLFMEDAWEKDAHNRRMPRLAEYRFPRDVWFVEGANRVLVKDPFSAQQERVRIHLVTARKYRGGKLYLWLPGGQARQADALGEDEHGPYFELSLVGPEKHLFAFKFIDRNGTYEPDHANRLYSAHDGPEIWVHSQAAHVSSTKPDRKTLTVHFVSVREVAQVPRLHVWQSDSDFDVDVPGLDTSSGERHYSVSLYTGRPYGFLFSYPDGSEGRTAATLWEHEEARREIVLQDDRDVWTLEGDHELFLAPPVPDREIVLEIVGGSPSSPLPGPPTLDVWANRARFLLGESLQSRPDGTWSFRTYPEIVTSFRFHSSSATEAIERHTIKVAEDEPGPLRLFIVLGKSDPLRERPVPDLFRDPPFQIRRPGVWEEDGHVRFALHAPEQTFVQVMGEWTDWRRNRIPMMSTRDESYWWAEVSIDEICAALGRSGGDYHGVLYKYVLNGVFERQDPAADWVESSDPEKASRLVKHSSYRWGSDNWQTPGKEYLIIYQIHPSRLSRRFAGTDGGLSPFRQVAREISDNAGYLRLIGVTAVQLMPVNEFAGDCSWGYGPSFYYAIESAYGGPDDLKYLVDTCHKNGLAVLLDVVFNHAGTSDNILWSVARNSFFDGDTKWGAMINFDHPQAIHFFEQNLVYLRKQYHVDGFRFDHTWTILNSAWHNYWVLLPGSGGGWEFLMKLRAALHSIDDRCILIAEQLPNDWNLSRSGGPMDTQWCDGFHDSLLGACKGGALSSLADSLKITHVACDRWHESVNYPESHDEVGNVNDRIATAGGYGQGLRRNKIAAAATLLSRGIPMWFMGAESGETAQFLFYGNDPLDLDRYIIDENCCRTRAWWNVLCVLRRGNNMIQGPSPIAVHFAQEDVIVFSRGEMHEYIAVLNFGSLAKNKLLWELNLPEGTYRELWNSTWPAFAVEWEDEHANGGRDARLGRGDRLNIPDYGCVILERA
jgi:1,4-alpha-glucan branching enzyme